MTEVCIGRGENARYYMVGILALFLLWPVQAFCDNSKSITAGDQAVAIRDHLKAEKIYTQVLEADPENFRVMKSLAEVKIILKKFKEANALFDRILAMEVYKGKKVLVTLEGEPEPLEAELVDETVILKEDSKNNMRNYLTPVLTEPVPHYRFFFFKSGKMELVAKRRAKFKYTSVSERVREEVVLLQGQVKMQMIQAEGSQGPAEMVSLEGGCFKMGSDKGEPDETPVHEVCVSPFKMDKFEVTQRDFLLQMGTNMSLAQGADLPAESVTWIEADQYCEKLNKRLPTEAEWEYAARAGSATEYSWGDEFDPKQGNFCDQTCIRNLRDDKVSDGYPVIAPVGSFPANAFGLHDMAGNVNEWVADWMEERYYFLSPKKNPKGPVRAEKVLRGGTNMKVIRGGSWTNAAPELRHANRKALWVDYRIEDLGFRCAADQ
ncbi:GldJ [hydrothermal vent metagenome]|uniref:GldJ n=1 Tax=hydrothermal vent metagenome TaxID=652676 RepID=A0A3B1CKH0_9ZZZZ